MQRLIEVTETLAQRRARSFPIILYRATPYLFLIPAFGLLLVLRYMPAISAIYHSLANWDGVRIDQFIGFQNYIELAHDSIFRASLFNLLRYTLVRVIVVTFMAFLGAELVYNLRSERARFLWKIVFVLPMVVPWVVTIMVWDFIYQMQFGLLNQFLAAIGLGALRYAWLGKSDTGLWAVAMVGFPFIASLQFLIIISGLQDLPSDIKDAALIDGCSTLSRILRIDVPLVRGPLALCFILEMLWSLQRFDIFLITTQGGPGYATEVPGLYMYTNAFYYTRFGYATAIGTVLLIIALALSYVSLRLRYRGAEFEQ